MWRIATLFRHTRRKHIVLWCAAPFPGHLEITASCRYDDNEYEGLSGDYSFTDGLVLKEGNNQIEWRSASAKTKKLQSKKLQEGFDAAAAIPHKDVQCCHVCGSTEQPAQNGIISCVKCNVTVHQRCYSVAGHRQKWLCSPCANMRDSRDTGCILCHRTGGALWKCHGLADSWAHLVCAQFVPETFLDYNIQEIMNCTPSSINLSRERQCILCNEPACVSTSSTSTSRTVVIPSMMR